MASSTDPGSDGPVRRGRWFEDFQPDLVIATGARTVTEADIAAFAGLSGDFNPLHVDEPFARRSAFRGRVAHGFLVEAIASGLAAQTGVFEGTIAALERAGIRFARPVRAGDTLSVTLTVTEVEAAPARSRGRVRFATAVFNQDGERVADGEWLTLMLRDRARRPSPESGHTAAQESAP